MAFCVNCGLVENQVGVGCPRCLGTSFAKAAYVSPASASSKPIIDYHIQLVTCPACQQLCSVTRQFDEQWVQCGSCGSDFGEAIGSRLDSWERRLAWLFLVSFLASVSMVVGRLYLANRNYATLERKQTEELIAARESHAKQLTEDESTRNRAEGQLKSAHEALLRNAHFLSGDAAYARHEAEWTRRASHDPGFATTPMELSLLKMERLGKDASIAAVQALTEVALMAAPKGSRVEIAPMGRGFAVKVAFKLSSLSQNESGGITKHDTADALRDEVRLVSAQLTRQLFDYCGSRGIERLQLSCNRALRRTAIPGNATETEQRELRRRSPLTMASIYRIAVNGESARSIASWRTASTREVMELFLVEADGLVNLNITQSGWESNELEDPDSPLEF